MAKLVRNQFEFGIQLLFHLGSIFGPNSFDITITVSIFFLNPLKGPYTFSTFTIDFFTLNSRLLLSKLLSTFTLDSLSSTFRCTQQKIVQIVINATLTILKITKRLLRRSLRLPRRRWAQGCLSSKK